MDNNTLRILLRNYIRQNAVTSRDIAQKIGVSPSMISCNEENFTESNVLKVLEVINQSSK